MAFVNEYALGMPCWFELGTTDQSAAKQFHSRLFGWSVNDNPMGPGQIYTIFQMDGRDVRATYTLSPKILQEGTLPHWNVYFAAPNLDATTAKIATLGGAVVQPPFDVMDVGRMSICKDPGAAMFSLWQPKRHAGAAVIGQDNSVCWAELATWDTGVAREFYAALFGWETKSSANMSTYIEFSVGGQPRGGLLPMDEQWKGIRSHWGIYFMVADCNSAAAKAKDLGATVRFGPFSAPGVGRIAALADPRRRSLGREPLFPVRQPI